MARIGGRIPWLAWPVGILSVGIVVVLVVMAAPLVPASLLWVGDTLRESGDAATGPATAADDEDQLGTGGDVDDTAEGCRQMYPDVLWSELTARTGSPVQDASAPVTVATSLATALAPSVERTCTWTATTTGTIVSTVSTVSDRAADIAQASLGSQGFACEAIAQGTYCTRKEGAVLEEHVFHGDQWLVTQLTSWYPDDYSQRVAAQMWP